MQTIMTISQGIIVSQSDGNTDDVPNAVNLKLRPRYAQSEMNRTESSGLEDAALEVNACTSIS